MDGITSRADWQRNGAGLTFSPKLGFGVLNAALLVRLAREATNQFPHQARRVSEKHMINRIVQKHKRVEDVMTVSCSSNQESKQLPCIAKLQHVVVTMHFRTEQRGAMVVELVSPLQTESKLLSSRPSDRGNVEASWEFSSVNFWHEDSRGKWKLWVTSTSSRASHEVISWQLTLHGISENLSQGEPVRSRSSVTLHNGYTCELCRSTEYPDGHGVCRSCARSCRYGCFGPGSSDCFSKVHAPQFEEKRQYPAMLG